MKSQLAKIAKEKLNKFLKEEWNQAEADYFETTEPYVTLKKYSEKLTSPNWAERIIYKRKYNQLLNTLSQEELTAKINYYIKLFEKKSLEFLIENATNTKAINQFTFQQMSHISEIKNPAPNPEQN